jgi:hypothetical protein
MITYFQFQYKRLLRSIKELGVNPYLAIVVCLLIFLYVSNSLFNKVEYFQYLYVVLAAIAFSLLGNADRNEFLKNIFTLEDYRKLRLFENLILALPFFFFLLFRHFYILAFVTLACSLICSTYNNFGRSNFNIPSPFSKKPFEFTVGFRNSYLVFIILYIIAIISISVGNFNLGIFTYLILFLVCLNFYAYAEPLFYVWIHAQQPNIFLKNKIRIAILYSFYISIPVAVSLVLFYPLKAYITVIVGICGLLYVVLAVLVKYTNYPGQAKLPQVFLMALGIIFPPLLLLLIPYFYLKSVKKLNIYLK